MTIPAKQDQADLACNATAEHFLDFSACNGLREKIRSAFRGGEANQLTTVSFVATVGNQQERLSLGFHEFGRRLFIYLWLGPNYRKNQALWTKAMEWEAHLRPLLAQSAVAEIRLMDPAFWLVRHGVGVQHITVDCA